MKKGSQPILYTLSSVASWAVDTGLFYLFHRLLGAALGGSAEAVCNVAARVISSFFNFNVNNRLVFQNEGSYGRAMLRYYCLAIPQLAAATLLLALFTHIFRPNTSEGSTLIKICVDGGLFVISFFIQKFWVFAKKENNNGSEDRKDK